jgi:hypothetical protein
MISTRERIEDSIWDFYDLLCNILDKDDIGDFSC